MYTKLFCYSIHWWITSEQRVTVLAVLHILNTTNYLYCHLNEKNVQKIPFVQ